MLLTLTTTHRPATDLGYLLFKHPDRVQTFTQSYGSATVFYPEATPERCTVALLVEVDPVRLARATERSAPEFSLAGYVNDRSYAASSLLGAAVADVFSTAGEISQTFTRSSVAMSDPFLARSKPRIVAWNWPSRRPLAPVTDVATVQQSGRCSHQCRAPSLVCVSGNLVWLSSRTRVLYTMLGA